LLREFEAAHKALADRTAVSLSNSRPRQGPQDRSARVRPTRGRCRR